MIKGKDGLEKTIRISARCLEVAILEMGNQIEGSCLVGKIMIAKMNFVHFGTGKTHKEKGPIP